MRLNMEKMESMNVPPVMSVMVFSLVVMMMVT
jgi:hypothetical protein